MGIFGFGKKLFQHIHARELSQKWPEKGSVLLDVRTPEEFRSGHAKGAKNIDVSGGGFHKELEQCDKNQVYYVVCQSGMRSRRAAKIMAKLGFKKVYNVRGGMMSW